MTQWQMRVLAATNAFVAAYAMAYFAGLRINLTDSIATGIWLTQDRPIVIGEYVMVCPPDNDAVRLGHSRGYIPAGWCPGGYAPLMKRIAGAGGAQVAIRADGMYVDGERLPHSAPLNQDGAGRPMVAWSPSSFQLATDQVLLYGDGTAASFDARYFGPVPRSLVLSVIVPIFVQAPNEKSMQEPHDPVPTLPALEEPQSPLRDALAPVPMPRSQPANAEREHEARSQPDRPRLAPNPLPEYAATLPDTTLVQRVVMQKFADAEDLDITIAFSPDEAAAAGAFEEPALPDAEPEHESR